MAIIKQTYVEKDTRPRYTAAILGEINSVLDLNNTCENFEVRGSRGANYSRTYHDYYGTTIVVQQKATKTNNSPRLKWTPRRFLFGGEQDKILRIVAQLHVIGLELKLIKL